MKNGHALQGVSETLLLPLYSRAQESSRSDAILSDPRAVELIAQINYDFARLQPKEGRTIGKFARAAVLDSLGLSVKHYHTTVALRTREFDRVAQRFLARHAEGVIVGIGCGLDTRYDRVDNGRASWLELDLPDVMQLRRDLLGLRPRCIPVTGSVLDDEWLEKLRPLRERNILFMAEGVFMYFTRQQVRGLLMTLNREFPGSEIVFSAVPQFYELLTSRVHPTIGTMNAQFRWGLKSAREPLSWHEGIELVKEWYYADQNEPRLGAFRLFRYLPRFLQANIVHYRLRGDLRARSSEEGAPASGYRHESDSL